MTKRDLRIIYIGSLEKTSNSFRRFKTLASMGHTVSGIDIEPYIYGNIFTKLHFHFNTGPGVWRLNAEIKKQVSMLNPDLVLVDNKPFVSKTTLKHIRNVLPQAKIINVITDDPTGQYRYAWRLCLETAYLYDCHFVQRKVNVSELKAAGAKRVEMCYRSYDPGFHRPIVLSQSDKVQYETQVGFIGTYEIFREEYIAHLITNGVPVTVTGDGWEKGKFWSLIKPYYKGPSVYGEAYVKSLNGMGIALHFLRHANRDEQDSRTFEIPACGVFMLAEKSDLHLALFEEGEEAVFFDSKEGLLEKVIYYMANDRERQRIAANGLQKVVEAGYDHASRLQQVLDTVFNTTRG